MQILRNCYRSAFGNCIRLIGIKLHSGNQKDTHTSSKLKDLVIYIISKLEMTCISETIIIIKRTSDTQRAGHFMSFFIYPVVKKLKRYEWASFNITLIGI